MELDYSEDERYLRAEKRVKKIKGFYWHLFWYLIVNIIWILILINSNEWENSIQYGFWGIGYGFFANTLFWGIGIVFHWFLVFGKKLTFSKDWEERKIKEFMEKDNY